jgi:hypothetical protein
MEFEWHREKSRRVGRRMHLHRLWSASTTPQGLLSVSDSVSDAGKAQLQTITPQLSSPVESKDAPEGPVVPVITVGHVFSPIPKGRVLLSPQALEAAKFLGLGPLLAAASGLSDSFTDEFLDIAAHTDPLNAVNILQSEKLLGRRLLFVERGAAVQLVSGRGKILQTKKDKNHSSNKGLELIGNRMRSFMSSVFPLLRRVTLPEVDTTTTDDTSPLPSVLSMKRTRLKSSNHTPPVHLENEEEQFIAASQRRSEWDKFQIPHLAKLPVRLALSLLCGLPERFLFLAQKGEKSKKTAKIVEFDACDRFSGLKVHMLEGMELVLHNTTTSCSVSFVPAFLSDAALRKFWKGATELYAEMVLSNHRRARREVVAGLQRHLAAVAAGESSSLHEGPKGQGPFDGRRNNGGDDDAGGGRGGEEESEGEPAEVMEVISELMGGGGDDGGPNFVTPPPLPLRPLVRAGAQFMCGAVTFAGIGINWLYDILDRLMYFHVPNGWKVLGGKVPPGPPPGMSISLNGLLQSMSDQNKSIATDRQLCVVNDEDKGNVKSEMSALLVPSMLAACLLKLGIESIDFRGLEKSIPLLFNMGQGFSQNDNAAKVSLYSLMSMPISLMSIQQRLQNLLDDEFLEKGELPSEAIAVALLQQLVPLLEYNAFHSLFPWCYNKTIDEESLKAVDCLFSEDRADGGEGSVGYKRVVLEPRFSVKDASKSNDRENSVVYEHFTQCKALVLIGNLESAPKKGEGGSSMQQLLQLGVPVGLDDGARYIAR